MGKWEIGLGWWNFVENVKAGIPLDIFCWGSEAPAIWISKGPTQNLKDPSIEIHYQFSNFAGSIALKENFTRVPLDFQGPRALTSGPHRALL